MSKNLDKLLYRVEQCIDYQSLYALEDSFNKCGLTVQTTSQNRVILAKLKAGKPVTKNIIDDYIFIGSLVGSAEEISERACQKICDFIRTNCGKAGSVKNVSRVWRNGVRMYEASIAIMNEDVNNIADCIQE